MFFRKVLFRNICILISSITLLSLTNFVAAATKENLYQRRLKVLQAGNVGMAGSPILSDALSDKSPLIRRAAIAALGRIGEPSLKLLFIALKSDKDALVRKSALHLILQIDENQTAKAIGIALNDKNELVRSSAIQWLTRIYPQTPEITVLLKKIQADSLLLSYKDGISLRNKPAFQDHELSVVRKIFLPKENWSFCRDFAEIGHKQKWFAINFDDTAWEKIKIAETWESQIGEDYNGIAWYRHTFTLPEKPKQDGTDIVFEGVDESAWVWINGEFIGQHDIGPAGWNKQFAIDISKELNWGEENQITVRVLDREYAGGIWKPVFLEVLKQ